MKRFLKEMIVFQAESKKYEQEEMERVLVEGTTRGGSEVKIMERFISGIRGIRRKKGGNDIIRVRESKSGKEKYMKVKRM